MTILFIFFCRIFGFLKKITNGAWKENDNFQVKVLSLLITVCEKVRIKLILKKLMIAKY